MLQSMGSQRVGHDQASELIPQLPISISFMKGPICLDFVDCAPDFPFTFWVILSILFVVVQSLSCVLLFVTPWTAARQASLSITISWSLLRLVH